MLLTHSQVTFVLLNHKVHGTPCVIYALLDFIRILLYVGKMGLNIVLTHHKTITANFIAICVGKILFPTKRNITALYNEILPILNGRLYYFTDNRPQIVFQFLVIIGVKVVFLLRINPIFKRSMDK